MATQTPQYHADLHAAGPCQHTPITGTNTLGYALAHGESGLHAARHRDGRRVSLQRCAGNRCFRSCRRARSGRSRAGDQQDHRLDARTVTPRFARRRSWPGADDAVVLRRPSPWSRICNHAGLSAHRGEFPVVARSVHHDLGATCGAGRNRLVIFNYSHDSERACAHGNNYVHGAWPRRTASWS